MLLVQAGWFQRTGPTSRLQVTEKSPRKEVAGSPSGRHLPSGRLFLCLSFFGVGGAPLVAGFKGKPEGKQPVLEGDIDPHALGVFCRT